MIYLDQSDVPLEDVKGLRSLIFSNFFRARDPPRQHHSQRGFPHFWAPEENDGSIGGIQSRVRVLSQVREDSLFASGQDVIGWVFERVEIYRDARSEFQNIFQTSSLFEEFPKSLSREFSKLVVFEVEHDAGPDVGIGNFCDGTVFNVEKS